MLDGVQVDRGQLAGNICRLSLFETRSEKAGMKLAPAMDSANVGAHCLERTIDLVSERVSSRPSAATRSSHR